MSSNYTFNGTYGFYDINVRYLYEVSGQSSLGLYVHYEVTILPGIPFTALSYRLLDGPWIEITGYTHPDWATFHMWGTPFELISYKPLNLAAF